MEMIWKLVKFILVIDVIFIILMVRLAILEWRWLYEYSTSYGTHKEWFNM